MKKKMYVELLDKTNSVVKKIQLNEIAIKEDYILTTSKEEYDNNEPCIIIRTCIRNDIYRKLTRYIKKVGSKSKERICVESLPIELKESIDLGDKVESFRCS